MNSASVADSTGEIGSAAQLEQRIRARIESLSYLPTTVAVAMKFVELGKNPDPDPAAYAEVISGDTSLSVKLLSLANSPWFGIRNKVTSVRMAVNLLGLGTVRTLAISYCMAGLHNELRLSHEEAGMFWEAALCKAVAAREYAKRVDRPLADEAFVAGMFQDFALSVMFAEARKAYLEVLEDPSCGIEAQMQKERDLFRLDHCEVGRILAQKLDLPEVFADSVALHHEHGRLVEVMESATLADAVYVASLFPHVLNHWSTQDADHLCAFVAERVPEGQNGAVDFLDTVQNQFNTMYHFFEEKDAPETRLAELMADAAKSQADNTTHLVRTVNELMHEAISAGLEITQLAQKNDRIAQKARHDALTGVLNREAFVSEAEGEIAKAQRYGTALAVVYLDIDRFKSINDRLGHAFGDRALVHVAACLKRSVRSQDLVARMGGDEFVMLLCDYQEPDACRVVRTVLERVHEVPIREGADEATIALSAGLVYIRPPSQVGRLDTLIHAADRLMYEAKNAGGNRVQKRIV